LRPSQPIIGSKKPAALTRWYWALGQEKLERGNDNSTNHLEALGIELSKVLRKTLETQFDDVLLL
jgi:hypothetical protein